MPATLPQSVRYHALDIWRGVVCLVVVLEHAAVALWSVSGTDSGQSIDWLRQAVITCFGLNIGAPLFFVISGYCIAASLDSTRRKGIKPSVFLARRLWRIFPPYWASMAIIAALVLTLNAVGLRRWHTTGVGLELFDPQSLHLSQWFGNITLTETWRLCVAPGSEPKLLNRVAWALCYQEQFYLVCFFALLLLPQRLYGAIAAATLAIVTFRVVTVDIGADRYFVGLFPDLWHEFAIGLVLYWRINVTTNFWAKRGVELSFLLTFLIGFRQEMISTQAAAIFGMVLLGFHRWDAAIAKIPQFNPLRSLGKRSYSVYLIHLPVCTVGNAALAEAGLNSFWLRTLVMIPVVTGGSVIAGYVFFATIDRRFGNLPIVGRFSRTAKPPQAELAVSQAHV